MVNQLILGILEILHNFINKQIIRKYYYMLHKKILENDPCLARVIMLVIYIIEQLGGSLRQFIQCKMSIIPFIL